MPFKTIVLTFSLLLLAQDVAQADNLLRDNIYRIEASGCDHQRGKAAVIQSGFSDFVHKQKRIITALHGVVGCKLITATVNNDKVIFLKNLEIMQINLPKDLAALGGTELNEYGKFRPLPKTNLNEDARLLSIIHAPQEMLECMVHGYPHRTRNPTESPIQLTQLKALRKFLEGTLNQREKQAFSNRKSPSLYTEMLSAFGSVEKGHSGAPIIEKKTGRVIAVVDGAIRDTDGFKWAIPYSQEKWLVYDPEDPVVKELSKLSPQHLFAASVDIKPSHSDVALPPENRKFKPRPRPPVTP